MGNSESALSNTWTRGNTSFVVLPGVTSHVVEDRVVVFSERDRNLYELNHTAGYLWTLLGAQASIGAIVDEMTDAFGISKETARGDVETTLASWVELGLIAPCSAAVSDLSTQSLPLPREEETPALERPAPLEESEVETEFFFNLAGARFRVRLPALEHTDTIIGVFSHLLCQGKNYDWHVEVVFRDGIYRALSNGGLIGSHADPKGIPPLLTQTALVSAYRSYSPLIAIHAGVVRKGRSIILLPGPSGIGKSTLVAGLMKQGYTYLTDEVAVIERTTHRVIPCPVSLRIKDGSWDTVSGLGLADARVFRTLGSDGSTIRYLVPPPGSFDSEPDSSHIVSHMVFPKFCAEQSPHLLPLGKIDALRGISEAGWDMSGGLDSACVEELIGFVKKAPAYSLVYNDLDSALDLIGDLIQ